jgi:hypothetical protein
MYQIYKAEYSATGMYVGEAVYLEIFESVKDAEKYLTQMVDARIVPLPGTMGVFSYGTEPETDDSPLWDIRKVEFWRPS